DPRRDSFAVWLWSLLAAQKMRAIGYAEAGKGVCQRHEGRQHEDGATVTTVRHHDDPHPWCEPRPQFTPEDVIDQYVIEEDERLILEVGLGRVFGSALRPVAGEREKKNVSVCQLASGG